MKDKKAFIKQHALEMVLLVVLLVSLGGNVWQQAYIAQKHADDNKYSKVRGTYVCGEQVSPDAIYLVLEDKKYMIYQQYHVLDEGEYLQEEEGVLTLQSHKGGETYHILHQGKKVYQINEPEDVFIYYKIDDVPFYSNVQYSF